MISIYKLGLKGIISRITSKSNREKSTRNNGEWNSYLCYINVQNDILYSELLTITKRPNTPYMDKFVNWSATDASKNKMSAL